MLKQRFFILSLLFILLFSACGRPSWVLSEEQMEDVLFDIHIADAEISNSYSDFQKEEIRQELYASVYKKHEITQQQFDTSLVWYGQHLKKYFAIYERLGRRYTILSDSINGEISRIKEQKLLAENNIWKGFNSFLFEASDLMTEKRFLSFSYDSVSLSKNQTYEFAFAVLGVRDSTFCPLVTLASECGDSVCVERVRIFDNGLFSMSIPVKDSVEVKNGRIFGSVFVPRDSIIHNRIFIYNIGLYKKGHRNSGEPKKAPELGELKKVSELKK